MEGLNKNYLLSKYTEQPFIQDSFPEEVLQHKEWIFDRNFDDSLRSSQNRTSLLPSCFIVEENLGRGNRRSPRGLITWRKASENERRGDGLKISNEVDIKISGKDRELNGSPHSKENIVVCEETKFNLGNSQNVSKLIQLLRLMKTSKKKNKKLNIKNILQVNEKLNVTNESLIWFLNCKKGVECNFNLLFGPFSSNQVIDFYDHKNVNESTELRLNLDIIEPYQNNYDNPTPFDEITPLLNKDFKLKDMLKFFNLKDLYITKQEPKKRKISSNYEEVYYNNSLYNMVMKDSTTPTNKKPKKHSDTVNPQNKKSGKVNQYNQYGTKYEYSDEYYYNVSVNRANSYNKENYFNYSNN